MSTATEPLMTADEFLAKYGDCSGVELVNGRVVWGGRYPGPAVGDGTVPKFKHGVVCHAVDRLIGGFVKAHDLGWVAINDTFVPTSRTPPSVRGADFLYVSYARLPKGETPDELEIPPDLVVEVRSPTDRLSAVNAKALEYLDAGVRAVVVLDPKTKSAAVFQGDEFPRVLRADDELTLPDVLPGFAVPVRRLFE